MKKTETSSTTGTPIYLTPLQIAARLQIGKDKAYKLCSLDGFPAIKLNNSYRIDPIRFDLWLENNLGKTIYL